MENPIIEDNYEKAKKEAKEYYNKIGRIWCPALNEYIAFNSDGFRHLVWKGHERRPHGHQMKRFLLISDVTEIIADPAQEATYRKKKEYSRNKWNGAKTIVESEAHFWAFRAKIQEKYIRIIIRQIGNGQKHFFSVFEEEKQKTTHE